MTRIQLMAVSLLVPLMFVSARPAADAAKAGQDKSENKLIGTWRLVSARYGGQDFQFPAGTTMLKHVTAAQFMWVSYDNDGQVFRAAGGQYSIKGDTYEETPEYGMSADFDQIRGKAHSFKWKVDGNKWHHDGKLSGGLTIEEVWERVEKK
jgi:hypothetical protein